MPGTDARQGDVASFGEAEIRAALDRVVASPSFRPSPQLASFLRFVVEATLAGDADRLKGYSIATGALGRNDSFDPQTDPIVRVGAGRLRRALELYYAGPGRHDDIVIALPRGGYIPTFARRRATDAVRAFTLRGRRLIPRAVRQRARLIAFVVGISAAVSLTFDVAFLLAQRSLAWGVCAPTTAGDSVLDDGHRTAPTPRPGNT